PPGAESPFAAATPPPDTPFATPRAKFPVVTRHRKGSMTSMVVVAAAVVSSAAMFLFVAIVAAWWILAPRQAANVAMAPSGPEVGGSAVVSPPTAPEVITPVESSPPAPSPVPVPVPAAPTNDRTKAATSQQRVAL